jgi:predicted nucleic acid-binding protein
MGMTMRRVYLDACAVIYYIEKHPVFFPLLATTLLPEEGEAAHPVFSDLTRLECRVQPMRTKNQELLDRYDTFFALPDNECVAFGKPVFDLATELRANQGLKAPDALHLAAAIQAGCDEFWTNDDRLNRASSGRIRTIVFQTSEQGS